MFGQLFFVLIGTILIYIGFSNGEWISIFLGIGSLLLAIVSLIEAKKGNSLVSRLVSLKK